MTLTEMLVAVVVLAIMMGLVGALMVSARDAVKLSQTTMDANATARAIADRIRADVATVSKDGFLILSADANIVDAATNLRNIHLIFTAGGSHRSVSDANSASMARIDYGLTFNRDVPEAQIFWRRVTLLDPADTTTDDTDDHEKICLADYRRNGMRPIAYLIDAPRNYLERWVMSPWAGTPPRVPPDTLTDVAALRPFLLDGVTRLEVQWTDGAMADGQVQWYGQRAPRDPLWTSRDWADYDMMMPHYDAPELNVKPPGSGSEQRYGAIWTFRKKNVWPRALRVSYTVGSGATARSFEIVVPVPQ